MPKPKNDAISTLMIANSPGRPMVSSTESVNGVLACGAVRDWPWRRSITSVATLEKARVVSGVALRKVDRVPNVAFLPGRLRQSTGQSGFGGRRVAFLRRHQAPLCNIDNV